MQINSLNSANKQNPNNNNSLAFGNKLKLRLPKDANVEKFIENLRITAYNGSTRDRVSVDFQYNVNLPTKVITLITRDDVDEFRLINWLNVKLRRSGLSKLFRRPEKVLKINDVDKKRNGITGRQIPTFKINA